MKFSEIIKHKYKGSGLLVIAIVSAVIVSMTALSVAKVNQLAFSGTISNRIALQAQQYAASKMDLLEAKGYANLTNQAKTTISGSSFSDSVTVGSEYNGTNGIKCKDVTVNVYYDKNTVSSFSLKRSMYKATEQSSGFFAGWNNNFPASGVAAQDGIIVAQSGFNATLVITTSGVEKVNISCRSKYGQGYNVGTCPIKKGESYSITGYRYIRFMKMG